VKNPNNVMRPFYVTFAVNQVREHGDRGVPFNEGDWRGWVTVWARNEAEARGIAFARFGHAWSDMYGPGRIPPAEFFPNGEIMVIGLPWTVYWHEALRGCDNVVGFDTKENMTFFVTHFVSEWGTVLRIEGPE
jgi:hypothetical protein